MLIYINCKKTNMCIQKVFKTVNHMTTCLVFCRWRTLDLEKYEPNVSS